MSSVVNHAYLRLSDGTYVSESRVNSARRLLDRVSSGNPQVVTLSDEELYRYGEYVDAVRRYWQIHECTLAEARDAIQAIRKEVYN